MSVDIFGRPSGGNGTMGPLGLRGSKGDPGKGGMEQMCMWMPNTILNKLQEEEEQCCLIIEDPSKDIKRDGSNVTKWVSRTEKCNAKAEKPMKNLCV